MKPNLKNSKFSAYSGLVFVIFMWGVSPLITLYFYKYFSPTIRIFMGTLLSAIALFLISRKNLHLLTKKCFQMAVLTGFFLAVANILQKIGLKFSTPAHYAFLENLSVLVVPILLFLITKKRPSLLTTLAAFLCLASSLILTGVFGETAVTYSGDILCALAGVFYGVNIAVTGTYAKEVYVPVYLMLQTATEAVICLVAAIAFHATGIETILFTLDWKLIAINAVLILVTSTLCWVIRTNAMKKVDATVVAVMMPFSSVITTVSSILLGSDTFSLNLIAGIVLGLAAVILSAFGDHTKKQ